MSRELDDWEPIETAPETGLIVLAVEAHDGERRALVAEASHEDGKLVWMITVGWTGWTRLRSSWTPIFWRHLPKVGSRRKVPPVVRDSKRGKDGE